jgi:hypothetical protein
MQVLNQHQKMLSLEGLKMPAKEEFKNMIYDLLIYLQKQNDVILYATEETLKKELELLYKECEWRYENGKQRF